MILWDAKQVNFPVPYPPALVISPLTRDPEPIAMFVAQHHPILSPSQHYNTTIIITSDSMTVTSGDGPKHHLMSFFPADTERWLVAGDNWGLISRDFLLVTLSLCPRVILNTLYDPRPAFLAFLRTHIIIISRTVTFTSNNPGVSGAGPGPRAHTSWQPEPHQLLFLHPLISCLAGGRRTCVLYVSGYPALATPTLCNCKKLLRCKNH